METEMSNFQTTRWSSLWLLQADVRVAMVLITVQTVTSLSSPHTWEVSQHHCCVTWEDERQTPWLTISSLDLPIGRGLPLPLNQWNQWNSHVSTLQTVVGRSGKNRWDCSSGDHMSPLRKRSISVGLQWSAFVKENQDSSSPFSILASGYVQIQQIQPILASDLHGCSTDTVLLVYCFPPGFHVLHQLDFTNRSWERII